MSDAAIAATKRFGEIVNTGALDAFPEVVAEGCVDNDPAPGQVAGPEGDLRDEFDLVAGGPGDDPFRAAGFQNLDRFHGLHEGREVRDLAPVVI